MGSCCCSQDYKGKLRGAAGTFSETPEVKKPGEVVFYIYFDFEPKFYWCLCHFPLKIGLDKSWDLVEGWMDRWTGLQIAVRESPGRLFQSICAERNCLEPVNSRRDKDRRVLRVRAQHWGPELEIKNSTPGRAGLGTHRKRGNSSWEERKKTIKSSVAAPAPDLSAQPHGHHLGTGRWLCTTFHHSLLQPFAFGLLFYFIFPWQWESVTLCCQLRVSSTSSSFNFPSTNPSCSSRLWDHPGLCVLHFSLWDPH